jgi:hypothetical protein
LLFAARRKRRRAPILLRIEHFDVSARENKPSAFSVVFWALDQWIRQQIAVFCSGMDFGLKSGLRRTARLLAHVVEKLLITPVCTVSIAAFAIHSSPVFAEVLRQTRRGFFLSTANPA